MLTRVRPKVEPSTLSMEGCDGLQSPSQHTRAEQLRSEDRRRWNWYGVRSESNLHPLDSNQSLTEIRIWLIDLNRQLPSAQLDGFDISAEQYPPKQWLPTNLSLSTLDIFPPVPEELIGKYDIIHVRLFILVVRDDDPTPILRNLISMLSQ